MEMFLGFFVMLVCLLFGVHPGGIGLDVISGIGLLLPADVSVGSCVHRLRSLGHDAHRQVSLESQLHDSRSYRCRFGLLRGLCRCAYDLLIVRE